MARKRGNGEGGVYKDAARNRWVAAVSRTDANGDRKRVKRFARSKAEALAKLRELNGADPAAVVDPGTVNVATILRGYFADAESRVASGRLRVSTITDYKQLAKLHLYPELGGVRAGKLTPDVVRGLLSKMEGDDRSASVRRKCLTIIRQAFKVAARQGRAGHDPTAGIPNPQSKVESGGKTLSPPQARLLLRELASEYHGPILIVSLGAGTRISELVGLEWPDVREEPPAIVVRRASVEVNGHFQPGGPKTNAGRRHIPLPPFAMDALVEQRKRSMAAGLAGCPLVFPGRTGRFRGRSSIWRAYKRVLIRAGLPDVRIHDLRHTHATLLLEAGENPGAVASRLGHTKVATTLNIYGHVTPSMQTAAAARIGATLTEPDDDPQSLPAAG